MYETERSILEATYEEVADALAAPEAVTRAVLTAACAVLPEASFNLVDDGLPGFTGRVSGIVVTGAGVKFSFLHGDDILVGLCEREFSDGVEGVFLFLESPVVKRFGRHTIKPPEASMGTSQDLLRWMSHSTSKVRQELRALHQ